MNSSTTTSMDQIGNYWGMWGARRSSGSSTASPISAWAAAYGGGSGGEPSWEEQAFARDAAAHLGGCVWPPRSYSCTFCQREFRSAQALGGHMNVHRRDRALLRQGGSSSSPEIDVHAPNDDHQPQQGGALLYRAAAAAASNPSSTTTAAAGTTTAGSAAAAAAAMRDGDGDGDAKTTTPTSYLSTIIKESKNKLFMTMPADHSVSEMREDQAAIDHQSCDHDSDGEGGQSAPARKKRRRLDDHPLATAAALLIFVQPTVKAAADVTACESQGGADHAETKVPQTTTPITSRSPLLDHQRQELDLELRLGTTPTVTYMHQTQS